MNRILCISIFFLLAGYHISAQNLPINQKELSGIFNTKQLLMSQKPANNLMYLNDSTIYLEIDSLNLWNVFFKVINHYDNKGNLVNYECYWKNNTTELKPFYKVINFYNALNQLVEMEIKEWADSTNSWIEDSKTFSFYNSKGGKTIDSTMTYNSQTMTWNINSKLLYFYDVNDYLTLAISYFWNDGIGWENSSKGEYTNDISGKRLTYIYSKWNSNQNIWENTEKNEYTYNLSNGELVSEEKFYWFFDYWGPVTKKVYLYNNNNQLTEEYVMDYGGDLNGYITSYIINYNYDIQSNNYLKTYKYWNDNTFSWIVYKKDELYWSQHNVNNISDLTADNNNILVYPNPADNILYINYADLLTKVEIFTIDGKKIMGNIINNENSINISSLQRGCYFISLQIKGKTLHQKFFKE